MLTQIKLDNIRLKLPHASCHAIPAFIMNNILLFCSILIGTSALAAKDLENVSTQIGTDPQNPSSQFVKCAIESGLKSAYGNSRKLLVVGFVEPAATQSTPPEEISISFVTQDEAGLKDINKINLVSTDLKSKWQIEQADQEIFYFSTTVSPNGKILNHENAELAVFDLSSCQ